MRIAFLLLIAAALAACSPTTPAYQDYQQEQIDDTLDDSLDDVDTELLVEAYG